MSLHLNLAMGYLKLAEAEAARDSKLAKDNEEQYLKKARDSCTDALQVDGTCAKAYFRRATAMEKLKVWQAFSPPPLPSSFLSPFDRPTNKDRGQGRSAVCSHAPCPVVCVAPVP